MRKLSSLIVVAGFALTACATEVAEDEPIGVEDHALSGAARRPRAERIRDVAKSRGFKNGVLLAGVASVETGLSHCWSEATWACKGPTSTFCNGPVIAGSADGPCSSQQGGLGMFQFDGGTYSQTIKRDGKAVLELDGNISHAVDFVANIVKKDLGLATNADAVAWMNGLKIKTGDSKFERWKKIMSCKYNGACSTAQANKYGNATVSLYNEFGSAFWTVPASVEEGLPEYVAEGETSSPDDETASSE
jgi:hypothetical protein